MKQIWSPWRMEYLQNSPTSADCPFCAAIKRDMPAESLLVHEGREAFVALNRYPYTTGHLLVLPADHLGELGELDAGVRGEIMELINRAVEVLREVYQPEGFNVGLNLGRAAGAGLPGHLHWHIVPRWSGDTNFMTAVGESRVLPESLEDTRKKITLAWENT